MSPSTHPTAHTDQITAATDDVQRALRHAAKHPDAHGTQTRPGPWLQARIRELVDAMLRGQIDGCAHLATGPRTALAALWHPGIILCTRCAPALMQIGQAEQQTCDRCHTHTDHLRSRVSALGPLMLAYGLCPPCARREDRDHLTPRRHRK